MEAIMLESPKGIDRINVISKLNHAHNTDENPLEQENVQRLKNKQLHLKEERGILTKAAAYSLYLLRPSLKKR